MSHEPQNIETLECYRHRHLVLNFSTKGISAKGGVWSNIQDHENEKSLQTDLNGIRTSRTFVTQH